MAKQIMRFKLIRNWGYDKGIIRRGKRMSWDTSLTQCQVKLGEEVGELEEAIKNKDIIEYKDAIGDCVVVLTMLASQQGLTIEECIQYAYDNIKSRKGRLENGIFIKD